MSWLAGETKWWLLLAALLGFVLMWLFQLRRVSVTETASRGASRDGSLGGKAVAGAGAVGAGAVGAGAALKDRIGLDKPDVSKPDLSRPDVSKPDLSWPDVSKPDLSGPEVAEPSYDAAPVDEATIARPRTEQSSFGSNGSSFDTASPEGDVDGSLPERSVTSEPASGAFAEPEVAAESAPTATSSASGVTAAGVGAAGVGAAGVGAAGVGSSGVDEEVDARTVVRPQRARHLSDEADEAEGVEGAQGLETGEGAAGRPAPSSFGAGTAEALPDGSSPHPDYLIKGNADSMKFHTIESPYYGRTKAEVWFDAEESARAAGFRRWDA